MEVILRKLSKIRKEADRILAQPVRTAVTVEEDEAGTVVKVVPKSRTVVGVSDVQETCKERDSVECAGLSTNLEYNCTGECGCEFVEEEMEDWLEELRERLGLEPEDPYLLQVRRPQVQTQSHQTKCIKSGKAKAIAGTVSSKEEVASDVIVSNIEPVPSTDVKEVRETDEPGGAKVKSVLEAADKMLESLAEVNNALDAAVNVLEEVDSKETDVLRDDAGNDKSVKSPRSKAMINKKVRPNAKSSQREETEVHPIKKPGGNMASKIKTVLGTVVSVLTKVVVCLLVAGLLGSVDKDQAECCAKRSSSDNHCEFTIWREVYSVVILRGEVEKVHFGKVYSPKFPWFRGKREDDVMMRNNHSTHAPGTELTVTISTRRSSNTAVSDWQQDAEARMGSAGLGRDGKDFSGTRKAELEIRKYTRTWR